MADIRLVRLDDRLVHGQVVTKWVQVTGCKRIIIVDDELAKNDFLASIFRMAAPQGVKVDTMSAEQVAQAWSDDKLGDGNVMVLFKLVVMVKKAFDAGLPMRSVQVAGLGAGPGKTVVFRTVSLSEDDARNLKYLQESGVQVEFQSIPEDKPLMLDSMLNKFFKAI